MLENGGWSVRALRALLPLVDTLGQPFSHGGSELRQLPDDAIELKSSEAAGGATVTDTRCLDRRTLKVTYTRYAEVNTRTLCTDVSLNQGAGGMEIRKLDSSSNWAPLHRRRGRHVSGKQAPVLVDRFFFINL